jgi:hypothetical protein
MDKDDITGLFYYVPPLLTVMLILSVIYFAWIAISGPGPEDCYGIGPGNRVVHKADSDVGGVVSEVPWARTGRCYLHISDGKRNFGGTSDEFVKAGR